MFVMDGDVAISIPTLVLVEKAERMAKFMGRHPRTLPPPESGDVDLQPRSFAEAVKGGVVAGISLAREVDVFCLGGARNEFNICAGIHPKLHRFFGFRRLVGV